MKGCMQYQNSYELLNLQLRIYWKEKYHYIKTIYNYRHVRGERTGEHTCCLVAALLLRQISLQAELSERKDKQGERAYLCEILLCRVKLYRRNSYVKA